MNLRPYQQAALDASLADWKAGVGDQLVVHPTGTGKSLVMSTLKEHHSLPGKVMVLVHREELAQQNAAHLRRWNGSLNVGVEMANSTSAAWDDVVVASVATIGRKESPRLTKFRPEDFSAIIVDEAHHAGQLSGQYQTVFEHFGVGKANRTAGRAPERLLLGVTATPNRSDGVPLGLVFDKIVHQFSIREAIQDGWLVDLKARQVRTGSNLDNVRVRAGDFAVNDLEAAVNSPERNRLIVSAYRTHAAPRQAVAFCVDVQHAKDLADCFRMSGVTAEAVWGEMKNRAEVFSAFRGRHVEVLTSVAVLTEGWDYPELECILLCRPTKSRLVVAQQVGRATRIPTGFNNTAEFTSAWHGKRDALILDFVDNTSKHSLAGLGSLMGLGDNLDFAGGSLVKWARKIEEAVASEPRLDPSRLGSVEMLETALREVDLFRDVVPGSISGFATMAWTQYGDGSFHVSIPGRGSASVRQNVLGQWQATVAAPTADPNQATERAEAQRRASEVILAAEVPDHFGGVEDAIGWTEKLLSDAGLSALLNQTASWRKEKPTEKQLAFARKLRITVPEDASRGEVSRAIDAALAGRGR